MIDFDGMLTQLGLFYAKVKELHTLWLHFFVGFHKFLVHSYMISSISKANNLQTNLFDPLMGP